jgi:hypothetical protein
LKEDRPDEQEETEVTEVQTSDFMPLLTLFPPVQNS